MFGWLFRKHAKRPFHEAAGDTTPWAPPTRQSKGSLRLEIRDEGRGWLSIPKTGFYGSYSRSPNGRFRVAWCDAVGDRGHGDYVLIDVEEIVCRGRMERPHDGKVADNGVFIFNDWRATSDLAGTFRAFQADGSKLLTQDYAANLLNNGLSVDGRLAACQTCNSSNEHDSAVLTVFDLLEGKELHRFRAESGWPHTYTFSADGETLSLGYANDQRKFAYKIDGTFVDRDAWISERLKHGDLYMARQVIDEAEGRPDPKAAKRLLSSVERGLAHKNSQDDSSQAFGLRLRGELLESMGELDRALESYDKALALNPKIGIKRRADLLRKVTAATPQLSSRPVKSPSERT